jgi:hypothetical protein
MALLVLVNANVNKKSAVYTESVSTGTHIIEALNDSMVDKYSVFVDDVPLLYKKNVQGITSHYIMGNGLSKKKGVVLIANSQTDLYRLIENGFYYGEISDYEGIYTNSEEAVEIIKNCGVAMNNYYSTIKHVDFVKDAKISSLALEENGKIILKGSDNKPLYGPYEILYNGNFKVNYCFKYMEGSLENEPVARVRFTANYGQTIYAEQEIYKSDFDENGFCNVTLERYIPSSETVEFIVYVNGDTVLEVQDICYWKEND